MRYIKYVFKVYYARQKYILYYVLLLFIFVTMVIFKIQLSVQIATTDNQVNVVKASRHDLSRFISYKRNKTYRNMISKDSLFGILRTFLPHLSEKNIEPILYTPVKKSEIKFLFGLPTIKREESNYLLATIESLIINSDPYRLGKSLFLVFIGESKREYAQEIVDELLEKFEPQINESLIDITSPNERFYPETWELVSSSVDSESRLIWRTKQNLDYLFMWAYAYMTYKFEYYIQMEDDVIAKENYMKLMEHFIMTQMNTDWVMLKLCSLGFIGNVFRRETLVDLSTYFAMFHRHLPCDWLIINYLQTISCNPAELAPCDEQIKSVYISRRQSLFQHVGTKSSLKGKTQELTDSTFGEVEPHLNPPATLESNFTVFSTYNFNQVYYSNDIFWALTPISIGTFAKIKFQKTLDIIRIIFQFGNSDHADDILVGAVLEGARFENNSTQVESTLEYELICTFNGSSVVDLWIEKQFDALRIRMIEDIPMEHAWFLIDTFEIHTK